MPGARAGCRAGQPARDRVLARLSGRALAETTDARGSRFVNGVLERAGEEGLARLWANVDNLPTPAEIEAPGLWLARIDL